MTSVRSGHTATLLRDRSVLLARWLRRRGPSAYRRALRPDNRPLRADGIPDCSSRRRHGDAAPRRSRARRGRLRRRPQPRQRRPLRPGHRPLRANGIDASAARGAHGDAAARRARSPTGGTPQTGSCARPRSSTLGNGRFSASGLLTIRRHKHAAALLRDGRVLVLGGSDEQDWGNRYRSAELFDPRTGRFSRTGTLSQPRFKLPDALAVTPSGAVLAAGGAQVVDRFRSGRFVPVARLDAARYYSTATLLKDGALLVVGGYDRAIRPTAQSFSIGPESRRAPRRGRARRR